MNRKKIKKALCIIFLLVIISILIILGLLWNAFLNKNNMIKKFEAPTGQEVYVLGTLHDYHFEKWANYSIANVLGAVENLKPDVIFIEAREKYFEETGAIDGPIDIAIVYSYCIDNNIPAKLIDWWEVDNNYNGGSTNKQRDDMIFKNIESKLACVDESATVLIVCGRGHLNEQSKRFLENGYKKLRLPDTVSLFEQTKPFSYPSSAAEIWEKRAYFYAYTYPEIISKNEALNEDIKQQFTGGNHDAFYEEQLQYNKLFSAGQLYKK